MFEKIKEISGTLLTDLLFLMAAWYIFYLVRFEWQWVVTPVSSTPPILFVPALVIAVYWIVLFAVFGLYRDLYLISRLDELIRVAKITTIGTLILFFLLFIDSLGWSSDNLGQAKWVTLAYWAIVLVCVSTGRFIVRTIQKQRVIRGKGLQKAVIVGTGPAAQTVYENLNRHRTSGMNVIGFLSLNARGTETETDVDPANIIGECSELRSLVLSHGIKDVIVALENDQRDQLIGILDQIDIPDVSVKILPDFYQMITGLNQTNQIFGLPLIDVLPDPMPTWEKVIKRVFDLAVSLFVLLVTAPLMAAIALAVKLTSPGPAIYRQTRVGKYDRLFVMYKFRTMRVNAESQSGPTWAKSDDPRITPLGYWLRKLRLDELPQFYNVLKGNMSLVGPRPERPYFVEQFKKTIPLYSRRLRVSPGITGWAQVKWKYDESMEDVVEKTKYDLFYVENISLKMDLKILINTIMTVIKGKGQ